MNKTRVILVIVVAVLLAFLASFGVYRYLSEKGRAAEEARLQTVGIVVALVDIPLGAAINANQIAVTAWPKDLYPKDSFADPKSVVGRTVRRDFLRGEPIVASKLVPTGKGGGLLSFIVPEGKRAFTIRVNEVVGVGGFIVPETKVDVILTAIPTGQSTEKVSKIVLENMQVLAAGQIVEQKENKPITVNTVTLSVTPEEAEKLALASNDGVIQLVLRNFADSDNVVTLGATKSRVLAAFRPSGPPQERTEPIQKRTVRRKSQPQVAPVSKKTFTVEVIKGNKRSEEKFE
jgi:pilus assembly protein CpaB